MARVVLIHWYMYCPKRKSSPLFAKVQTLQPPNFLCLTSNLRGGNDLAFSTHLGDDLAARVGRDLAGCLTAYLGLEGFETHLGRVISGGLLELLELELGLEISSELKAVFEVWDFLVETEDVPQILIRIFV